jgi:hypothetical protein
VFKRFYSKRARGTSANKEFGLRGDEGCGGGILFPIIAIAINLNLLVSALF